MDAVEEYGGSSRQEPKGTQGPRAQSLKEAESVICEKGSK